MEYVLLYTLYNSVTLTYLALLQQRKRLHQMLTVTITPLEETLLPLQSFLNGLLTCVAVQLVRRSSVLYYTTFNLILQPSYCNNRYYLILKVTCRVLWSSLGSHLGLRGLPNTQTFRLRFVVYKKNNIYPTNYTSQSFQ